jgi:hypothetical protein
LLAREDHIFVRSLPPSPALSCFFYFQFML